ncbi:MAG TPA: tyrosine-type recombinase/integrase [Acidimicrobiales bacterium]|nr:tyrosine-type recombinase/integrase [Acidimicrobiales bacterium]
MQGRVFQRNKGRGKPWSYAVDLPAHADGRRRQRLKGGFRTKDEAEKALARTLADAQKGIVLDPGKVTLGEYLEDWLASVSRSLKPTTLEGYAHAARVWIIPRIGGYRLTAVTPEVLEKLYATLETEGRQDGTGGLGSRAVRLAHQVLHLALGQAAKRQRILTNPADAGLHLPRQTRKPFRTWNEVEARRFLEACRGDRLVALWTLMVSTGMRRGEAVGLRWEDVDLKASRLSVVQHVVVVNNRPLIQEIKTPTSRRSLVLYPNVVTVLRKHRAAQKEEHLFVGGGWVESGLVFTTATGGVLHPRNMLRSFDAVVAKAGVPDITMHDLRHTAASLALRAGVHPKLVQEMLGHARVAITLDLYSHVVEEMHHDATDKLGRLLFPEGNP